MNKLITDSLDAKEINALAMMAQDASFRNVTLTMKPVERQWLPALPGHETFPLSLMPELLKQCRADYKDKYLYFTQPGVLDIYIRDSMKKILDGWPHIIPDSDIELDKDTIIFCMVDDIFVYNMANENRFSGRPGPYKITNTDYYQIAYNIYMLKDYIKEKEPPEEYREIYEKVCREYIKDKKTWRYKGIDISKPMLASALKDKNLQAAYEIISKVNKPVFECAAGNKKKNTFDFIRIRLGVISKETLESRGIELKKAIKDCKQAILRIALSKICDSKQFQRYGVPANFLRPARMVLTCQDQIEIIFELRDINEKEGSHEN